MEPDSDRSNFSVIPLADHSGEQLLRLWRAGDEQAAGVLVDRYTFRLIALVAQRMNQRFRGSIDPEDVVQSAMGSFFNAAQQDRIHISDSVSLWRLLAAFARRKLARSVEKQTAFKRGGGHTRLSLEIAEQDWLIENRGQQEEAVQELTDALAADLPQGLRDVLAGLLAGRSQKEIAESLAIDERTVRRRVVRLRKALGPELPKADARSQPEFSSDVLRRIG